MGYRIGRTVSGVDCTKYHGLNTVDETSYIKGATSPLTLNYIVDHDSTRNVNGIRSVIMPL